jgi:hypothetical protein
VTKTRSAIALLFLLTCMISAEAVQESQLANPESLPGVTELLGPELADLNGDGKLDLLLGNFRGTLFYRENSGTLKNPEFQPPKPLRTEKGAIRLKHW